MPATPCGRLSREQVTDLDSEQILHRLSSRGDVSVRQAGLSSGVTEGSTLVTVAGAPALRRRVRADVSFSVTLCQEVHR